MYTNTSEEFGQLVTSNGRTWKARIIVGEDVVEDILSIEVNRGSATGDTIEIGTAVAGYVEIIANSTLIFEDKEIILEEGLVLSDGTTEYISVGKFDVTKAVSKGERVTISAADILATKAESIYVTALTDTAEMIQEICAYLGISFEGELEGITIASPTGLTKREALGYIAGLYGKFACINRAGNLMFKWYEDTYLISRDDVEEPDLSQNDFIVNKLVVNNGTTEFTAGTSSSTGIFSSNPLMTEDLIEGAYTGLAGFKYRPGTINLILGDPRLDPWDMISYEDYILICGKITDVYDGGIKTVINSPGKSESESENNYKGPTAKALERYYAELVLVNEALIKKLDVEQLDAVKADIESAVIKELGTELLTVTAADIKYADIKLSNIDIADIGTFFADCGLIDRADIVEGHITGFLNSVEVNANKITAGTLIADRILLSGNNKGVLYALNNLGELTSESVDTLDGYVLTERTITADKIVANSITANEINVEDLFAQDITAKGTIRGAKFVGGNLKSENFTTDGSKVTSGMYIDLESGSIASTNMSLGDGFAELHTIYNIYNLHSDIYYYDHYAHGKVGRSWGLTIDSNPENVLNITEIIENDGSRLSYTSVGAGTFVISNLNGHNMFFGSDSGLYVQAPVQIDKATELGDTLDVTGATTLESTLDVKGNTIVSGLTTINNQVKIYSTGNQIKIATSSSGTPFFIRNDGNNTYFMLGDEGETTYNNFRPITIANATGGVEIGSPSVGSNLKVNGAITTSNYILTNNANIILGTNNSYFYGANTSGTHQALIGVDTNNQCVIAPSLNNVVIGSTLWVNPYGNVVIKNNNCGLYGVKKGTTNGYVHLIGLNANDQTLIAGDSSAVRIGKSPQILSLTGTMQLGASGDGYVTYISGSEVWVCNTAKTAYKVIKASAFTVSSTKKLKENVLPMTTEESRKIYDLDVVSFDYINGEKNQHGLIAEDVVDVIPSIVYGDVNATDPEGIMKITLNYVGLIPYILKEMQIHENKINKLINS